MTEAQAIHNFFNSFGITAYPSTAVPDNAVLPYMTYENRYELPFGAPVSIAVQLWFHTDSEAIPNAMVKQIGEKIGKGGIQISHDDGTVWITTGAPFCVAVNTQDNSLKVRQLNINLSYL